MEVLGHRNIKKTLIYTRLVNFENEDEFICKAAKTAAEAKQLIEIGFEYVCNLENARLFRQRK